MKGNIELLGLGRVSNFNALARILEEKIYVSKFSFICWCYLRLVMLDERLISKLAMPLQEKTREEQRMQFSGKEQKDQAPNGMVC